MVFGGIARHSENRIRSLKYFLMTYEIYTPSSIFSSFQRSIIQINKHQQTAQPANHNLQRGTALYSIIVVLVLRSIARCCPSFPQLLSADTIALEASSSSEQAKFVSQLRYKSAQHTSQPVIDLIKNKHKMMMLRMRTRSPAMTTFRSVALASILVLLLVTGPIQATDAQSEEQVCTADNVDSAECAGDLSSAKNVSVDDNDDGCTDDHVKCAEWADLGECGELLPWFVLNCQ